MSTLTVTDKRTGKKTQVAWDGKGKPNPSELYDILHHHMMSEESNKVVPPDGIPQLPKVTNPITKDIMYANSDLQPQKEEPVTWDSVKKTASGIFNAPGKGITEDIPQGYKEIVGAKNWDEGFGGAAKLGSGIVEAATPMIAAGAVLNPIVAARMLTLSNMTGKATKNLSKDLGAGPGGQKFSEFAGGMLGAGGGVSEGAPHDLYTPPERIHNPEFFDPYNPNQIAAPKIIDPTVQEPSGVTPGKPGIGKPGESPTFYQPPVRQISPSSEQVIPPETPKTPINLRVPTPDGGKTYIGKTGTFLAPAAKITDPTRLLETDHPDMTVPDIRPKNDIQEINPAATGNTPGVKFMPPGSTGIPIESTSQYSDQTPPPDFKMPNIFNPEQPAPQTSTQPKEEFDPVVEYYNVLDKIEQSGGNDESQIDLAIQGAKANKISPEQLATDLENAGVHKYTAMSRAYAAYKPGEIPDEPIEKPAIQEDVVPSKAIAKVEGTANAGKKELTLKEKIANTRSKLEEKGLVTPREARKRRIEEQANDPLGGGKDKDKVIGHTFLTSANPIGDRTTTGDNSIPGPGSTKTIDIYKKGFKEISKGEFGQRGRHLDDIAIATGDKHLLAIPVKLRIAETRKNAWLATNFRQLEQIWKGATKETADEVDQILDNFQNPKDASKLNGQFSFSKDAIDRATLLRTWLNAVKKQYQTDATKAGGSVGNIESYMPHMRDIMSSIPDMEIGFGQLIASFKPGVIGKSFVKMFDPTNTKPVVLQGKETPIPSAGQVEQRKLLDPDYQQLDPITKSIIYAHGAGKIIFDKPGIQQAVEHLNNLKPENQNYAKELAEAGILNYIRYDRFPQYQGAINAVVESAMRGYADSVLGFNTKLLGLHLARTGFIFQNTKLPDFIYGVGKTGMHPVESFREVVKQGLVPSRILAEGLKPKLDKARTISRFGDVADLIASSIGWQANLRDGMRKYPNETDASLPSNKAIDYARVKTRGDDLRPLKIDTAGIFIQLQHIPLGKPALQFKQVIQAITEKCIRDAMKGHDVKSHAINASKVALNIGISMALGSALGVHLWHTSMKSFAIGSGLYEPVAKEIAAASKCIQENDYEGAANHLASIPENFILGVKSIVGQVNNQKPSLFVTAPE